MEQEQLIAMHQSVLAHSTTPHKSWIPAAELAFDLSHHGPPHTSSPLLATCDTTSNLLLSEVAFLDSLDPMLLARFFWLQTRIASTRFVLTRLRDSSGFIVLLTHGTCTEAIFRQ